MPDGRLERRWRKKGSFLIASFHTHQQWFAWFVPGNRLSIGVDIETGGHVFQLHLTNARGMFERSFLAEPAGRWSNGDIYFGFNLSRVFQLKS